MPMSKKKYNEANAKRKSIEKQYKIDGNAKFAKPKRKIPKKAMEMAKLSSTAKRAFKSAARNTMQSGVNLSKKSLARKVVSKLGLAGKAAVGLSIGYDIIKGVKPQKQGSSCSSGHRTIKNGGQTFCISNAKIKKAKMKTTNKATPDIKSKR